MQSIGVLMEENTGATEEILKILQQAPWQYEGHAITVEKLLIAAAVLILGVILSILIKRFVRNRLLARTALNDNVIAVIDRLVYYAALLTAFLVALRVVHIPLTAFTFLGGAVALGVGFGAKDLINNFLSGFVLMLERPIKIGDIIATESEFGMVKYIGARCTHVRTPNNRSILIPNSMLLEKQITNWSMPDGMILSTITVSIAYGSDVRKAEAVMLETIKGHPHVSKEPNPFVLFREFGSSALVFDLYFPSFLRDILLHWRLESDIRFELCKALAAAGITIAFPQLDVHLDDRRGPAFHKPPSPEAQG